MPTEGSYWATFRAMESLPTQEGLHGEISIAAPLVFTLSSDDQVLEWVGGDHRDRCGQPSDL